MNHSLLDAANRLRDQIVAWRRHLHAHPELSGQERETARYIAGELGKLGLTPRENVGDVLGVTADLIPSGGAGGEMVALRADFDALPVQEETGLPFASRFPGRMHACGHDAHTAMLLGAASLLQRFQDQLARSVRFLFQPHEELSPGGAARMIADGALTDVGSVFGIHICSSVPVGELGTRTGAFMAATNPFRIVVRGRGGHAAMPEECVDAVVTASQIILALQTVVSRSIPPAAPGVVSVTQINGGTADNVLPNEVTLAGTIRTFDELVRETACRRVREIAEGVAAAHGAEVDVEIESGYPVVSNEPRLTETALEAAREVGISGAELVTLAPQGGGEDFAYYGQHVPATFVFLGGRNPRKNCIYPHHHPRFDIDEDALVTGAALHAQFALSAGRI